MKILNSKQIKEVDNYTIEKTPIDSIDLMENAAKACYERITTKNMLDGYNKICIFCGPGNNGGDGLAIARMLASHQNEVYVYLIGEKLSPDAKTNYERLIEQGLARINKIMEDTDIPEIDNNSLIIDAIFGSGITGEAKGIFADIIHEINNVATKVISIDIPSGLHAEDNSFLDETDDYQDTGNRFDGSEYPYDTDEPLPSKEPDEPAVIKATHTLTLELPFLSLFFPEMEEYVGEWEVVPIGLDQECIKQIPCSNFYITPAIMKGRLIKRSKFSHKGTYGHGLLVSGSYGKMGAAVLSSRACLRSGAGLLTTHIPKCGYEVMQTAIPEAMISIDKFNKVTSEVPYINNYSAIGIGPGVGKSNATQIALRNLLDKSSVPMIIDADAINIIGEHRELMDYIRPETIFTPHPREFERLVGSSKNNFQRFNMLKRFVQKYQVYIILKTANTIIGCPDGTCYFNTTGNPGMATAGSGDILTGIILAMLAQGYSAKNAALLGVYIHGLAGDITVTEMGEEAMLAGDIIKHLGDAFMTIKNHE